MTKEHSEPIFFVAGLGKQQHLLNYYYQRFVCHCADAGTGRRTKQSNLNSALGLDYLPVGRLRLAITFFVLKTLLASLAMMGRAQYHGFFFICYLEDQPAHELLEI
jgi:hypothetical protein